MLYKIDRSNRQAAPMARPAALPTRRIRPGPGRPATLGAGAAPPPPAIAPAETGTACETVPSPGVYRPAASRPAASRVRGA
ncbi:hypothetical protein GCM10017083_01200 [Thalassobaculum fulvum]|uniref:Uncharacterized protein n=1 Tax=Thalassobaculum fulvum TaxID=1633335 RepID=A0A919CM77_9PROT|nr:hypothetical protein GCM10017083_01200 [Thalassobaculum fulvum]